MNARLHRVIFNAARGIRMVVQETASSNGKGASGSTGRSGGPSPSSSPSRSVAGWALLATLAAIPAAAQITADSSAAGGQRATVLLAPNGVPLVNIQSPSGAGVSRNTFSQFDVNASGAILNNSRTNAATQLGGLVQGNPYLATGPARVILNEVNSTHPSTLRGYVEVAGTRAEVILANPAGIQVDGAGFINASKVTLTTGTAQFDAGAIESFLVRGGSVAVDGKGLDLSRTDFAAILSRALNVNAGIWANHLQVITGANRIRADLGQIIPTPAAGTSPVPSFALDVAALGGMYAGKIVLVGTELGVGVRNAGTLSAAAAHLAAGQPALSGVGEFTLTAAGLLHNTGTLQAGASAVLAATGLANNGTVASATELRITTQGDLANTLDARGGTLEAARLVLTSTAGDIDNRHGATIRQTGAAALTVTAAAVSNTAGGRIGAAPAPVTAGAGSDNTGGNSGTSGTGSTPSGGQGTTGSTDTGAAATTGVGGTTGTLTPSGPGSTPYVGPAPGSLTAAGTVRNDGGRVQAGGAIDLQTQRLNNAGGTLAISSLAVNQPTFSNAGGTLNIANAFSAAVGQFDNTGGHLDAGSLTIGTRGDLLNTDGTLNAGEVSLTVGGQLANARGRVSTPGALTATVAGALDNSAGTLGANQAVALTAQSLDNTQGAVYSVQAGVGLNLTGALRNDRGTVSAATDLGLQAGTLDNAAGTLRAGRDGVVSVAGAFTSDGRLTAGRHATLTAASLHAGARSVLGAGVQGDGSLAATGDLTVTTLGDLTAQGQNLAGGALALRGAAVDLTGSQTRAATLALTATQGDVTTNGATVATPGTLRIAANANAGQTLVNATGTLSAGQLDVQAANIDNTRGGQLVQTGAGTTTLATGTLDNTGGLVASNGQDLRLQATDLINTEGRISHAGGAGGVGTAGTLALDIGRYSGAGGTLLANGALVVRASGAFDQTGGTTSARQITMNVAGLSNRDGKIVQSGTGATRIAAAGALDNTSGTIATNGDDLTLSAGATLTNTLGTITHAGTGTFALDTAHYSAQRGTLAGNGALVVHAGAFDQDGGHTSASRITLDAASVSNRNATLTQSGAQASRITVAGLFDNTEGRVTSNARNLTVAAGTFDNTAGRLEHAGSGVLDLTVGSLTNRQGQIASNAALAVHGGTLHNDAGRVLATSIGIDAATLSNQGGTVAQTGTGATRIAVTGDLDNSQGGTLASNGSDLSLQVGGTLGNTQGTIVHAGSGTLGITAAIFDDRHGEVLTNGGLTLRGGRFLHDGSTTRVRQLDIAVDSISNVAGELVQTGTGTGTTRIAATGDIDNAQGRLASNAQDFTVQAGAAITSTGGRIEHAGAGTLTLDAARYQGAGGQITGNGALAVHTTGAFDQDGGTTAAAQIDFDVATLANRAGGQIVQTGTGATRIAVAGDFDNTAGTLASNGATLITAGSLSTRGGVVRTTGSAALDITVATSLDNSAAGLIGAGGNASVTAARLNNDTGRITAVGDLSATVAGALTNVAGTLAANGRTTLGAASLDNRQGTVGAVEGDLQVTTAGATTNAGGTLQPGGTTTLSNAGLDNTTGRVVGHALAIDTHANALNNRGGTLAGATTLELQTGALNNDAGLVQSGGALTVDTHAQALTTTNATGHAPAQGGLASGATLRLTTGALDNTGGFIGSKGSLEARTGPLTNAGGGLLFSQGALSVTTHGATFDNRGGKTQSVGDLTIDTGVPGDPFGSGAIDNTASLIRSAATTTLNAARVANANTLGADQGVEGRHVAITATSLANTAGAVRADRNATVTSAGLLDNTRGLLSAGDTLSLLDPNAASAGAQPKTLQVLNTGGTLLAGRSLVLDAARFSADGRVSSGQDLSLALLGDLTNHAEVTARGNLTYATTGTLTNHATLGAGQTLSVSATDVVNLAGAQMSGDTTLINAARSLTNRGLIDGRDTQINAGGPGTPGGPAGSVDNIGTGKIYGDHLSIAAGTVNNDSETIGGTTFAATLAARERLDLGVGVLNNREHALVFSAGDLFLGGALDASRQATGRAVLVNNASAILESIGTMQLASARIDNLNNHFSTALGAAGPTTRVTQYQLGQGWENAQGDDLTTRHDASAVLAYNNEADYVKVIATGARSDVFKRYEFDQSQRQSVVVQSDPGQILAGADLRLSADQVVNDKSRIVAGATLTVVGATVDNRGAEGQRITRERGTVTSSRSVQQKGRDRSETSTLAWAPPDTIETIYLSAGVAEGHTAYRGSAAQVGVLGSVGGVGSAAGTGAVDGRARVNPIVEVVAAIGAGAGLTGPSANANGEASTATAAAGTRLDSAPASTAGAVGATVANAANASSTGSTTGTAGATQATPRVIRTTSPDTTLPRASLFATRPDPSSRYLVETDPRFTHLRQWLSSDYLLNALGHAPASVHKRLGDGFYEQQLIDQQIIQLTGQRRLAGFDNNQDQYSALMNAGATFARAYGLRPGIALTPAQMAQLTSDIVWLVEQAVTLADGTTQTVWAPQVYVRVRPGDLDANGALLAGASVNLQLTGDLTNTGGTVAGRDTLKISAENINTLGGRLTGAAVALAARHDLNVIGASVIADTTLIAQAGHDLNLTSTTRSATSTAGASRFERTTVDQVAGLYVTGVTGVTGQGATSPGVLMASAGHDLNLTAATVVNAAPSGTTALIAGHDLKLDTVQTRQSDQLVFDASNHHSLSTTTVVASQVQGAGTVRLQAGRDLVATAAELQAGAALALTAGRDLTLGAAHNTVNLDAASEHLTSEGFLSSTTRSTREKVDERRSVGTSLGGTTVDLTAGRDLALTGAQVLADHDIHASAARNLSVSAATSTRSAQSHRVENDTGWFSTDLSFGYGTTTTSTDQQQQGSLQSGTQERSRVGSVNGSVTLAAGTAGTAARAGTTGTTGTADGALTVSGSDVQAGQDITASGTRVQIDPGLDRSDATTHTNAVTDAVSVAVGGSVVKAAQALQSLTDSATTKNKRLQALALVAQGLAAAQAAAAAVADGGSVSVSLTASHSESTTGQTDTATSHAGSQLSAGRNVQITATGAGTGTGTGTGTGAGTETGAQAGATNPHPDNGNITILGSGITAGRNLQLSARQDLRIAAAQDSEAHQTEHSDWTVGAGIGVSWSNKGGAALGVTANAGVGAATQQSQARTQLNSHLTAGHHLGLDSGRDTTVQGGVLSADRVSAEVGRNLTIASLQDTASASAKSANASVSATVGYGVSVSASLAYAQSKNDFASVDEQSAIRAGNGGFNVNVTGHTELQGGALTSTQQAVDAARNHLTTATLSTRDIANHSTASGIGLSVSASSKTGGSDKDANGQDTGNGGTGAKEMGGVKLADQGNAGRKMDSTSLGAASESDRSTTQSAISGATLTIGGTTTRTDQGEAAIATDSNGKPIHTATTGTDTAPKLARPSSLQDIQAQVKIVQSFGSQAAKAVGDYATGKARELRKEGNEAEAVKWDEGGAYRVAAHAVIGGLTGDVGGAIGATVSAAAAPTLNNLQSGLQAALQTAGLGDAAAQVIAQVAGTAAATTVGAAVGGTAGAVAALNEDANNRQLHYDEKQSIKLKANGDKTKEERLTKAACYAVQCWAQYPTDSDLYKSNYVSSQDIKGLAAEVEWVKNQKQQGQFDYTTPEKVSNKWSAFTGLSRDSIGGKPFSAVRQQLLGSPTCGNLDADCKAGIPSGTAGLNGALGIGYYRGFGGELELEFENNSLIGGKVGFGVGYGVHISGKTISGGLVQGVASGYKAPALGETNPQQAGEIRVGGSISVGAGVGVVGLEGSASRGASRTTDGITPFVNLAITPTAAPVIPKVGIEFKVNLIEFNVKPPVKNISPNTTGGQ